MENSYDALIKKFNGLLQQSRPSSSLTISTKGCSKKNLSCCLLIKPITDKPIQDKVLTSHLISLWGADPDTNFEALGQQTFLVEFKTEKEYAHVIDKGPWLYRQDYVAVQQIANQQELVNPKVTKLQLWVQMHHIPPGALSEDGLYEVAAKIGTPCSQILTAFAKSKKFYKIKIERDIAQLLPVTVLAALPSGDTFTVYISYEKMHMFCNFCSLVGHERDGCSDYAQLFRISLLPGYQTRRDLQDLLKKKVAPWLASSAYLPVNPESSDTSTNSTPTTSKLKRPQRPSHYTPHLLTVSAESMETDQESVASPSKPLSKKPKAVGTIRPLDI